MTVGSLARRLPPIAAAAAVLLTGGAAGAAEAGASTAHGVPHLAWTVPFVLLLLSVAVLPLVPAAHHWWEKNVVKLIVGLTLGAVVLGYYALRDFGYHDAAPGRASVAAVLEHAVLAEYVPFIVLLFSLYVVSGGVQLKGDLKARPGVNTGFLALGALLASFIGTTGASMVLIRPLLQTNRDRVHVRHTVIFFIFLVSNIGGCLLPIGDPPLFLGYLRGVPFLWTLKLVVPWAACVAALLVVYYVWDRLAFRREPGRPETHEDVEALEARHYQPLRLRGGLNLAYLLGIVLAVALIVPGRPLPGTEIVVHDFYREAVMMILAGLSLATTPRGLRKETEFTYTAIAEVGALFLGIFLTMQVPIEILNARGAELGLTRPIHFFWATGLLSSFLDNAPTYVVFFETARTLTHDAGPDILNLIGGGLIREDLLEAISLGAVFMGANTYIGNGPNFMVKAIAEQRGVKMPGFFGYMAYSAAVLLPLFAILSVVDFVVSR